MAEVKLSGIGVVDINGSIGNTTFARNFYGIYAKTRIGAPSGSSFLSAWQMEVSNLAIIWEAVLTEPQRITWYKAQRYGIDSMSNKIVITGYQLFMEVNLNLFLIGGAGVTTPPTSFARPQILPPTFSTHTMFNLSFTCLGIPATPCATYFTRNLPVGRMSNNQIYAFAGVVVLSNIAVNVAAVYTARLGAITLGKKIFAKFVPISPISGLRGVAQYCSAIIT